MAKEYDIVRAFQRIEEELIASMKRNLSRHIKEEQKEGFSWTMWQTEQLNSLKEFRKNNKKLFNKYFSTIDEDVEEVIKKAYETSQSNEEIKILKNLRGNKRKKTNSSFFKINERALNQLIEEAKTGISKASLSILRFTNDKYRKIIFNAQVYATTGAGTPKQAIDMATKDFLNAGINSIEYSDGRRINVEDYVAMAIQTATHRASIQGQASKRDEWGVHTVLVPNRGGGCPKCVKWQGKVFIDDVYSHGTKEEAKKQKYLLLSTAIAGGLLHPNCKDSVVTYFPEINSDVYPPTQSEINEKIKNYNIEQKLKYIGRNIKKYKRLEQGSLDNGNIEKYHNKRVAWQNYKKRFEENHNLSFKESKENSIIELSDDELYALNQYISSESYILNEALRDGFKLTEQQEKMKNNLDNALQKFPKYEGEVVRSLELSNEELQTFLSTHKEGNCIEYKAYTSTTAGTRYNKNSNVELYIKSKTGRDIRQFNKDEQEILFKRNSRFQVINVEETERVYYIRLKEL